MIEQPQRNALRNPLDPKQKERYGERVALGAKQPEAARAVGVHAPGLSTAGVPLHTLLGPTCRTEIAFSEYFALRERRESSLSEVAEYCARMVAEHGSPVFEGKARPLEEEVRLVGEVRAAIGPERMLRLDANMGWSLETARRALAALAPFDISNIEEPVGSFAEMAELRRCSNDPVLLAHARPRTR